MDFSIALSRFIFIDKFNSFLAFFVDGMYLSLCSFIFLFSKLIFIFLDANSETFFANS